MTTAKAVEDFAIGLMQGIIELTPEGLQDFQDVGAKPQQLSRLLTDGASKDGPRVQEIYRRIREDVG